MALQGTEIAEDEDTKPEDQNRRYSVAPELHGTPSELTTNPMNHIALPLVGAGDDTATPIPIKSDHIKAGSGLAKQ